MRSLDIGQFCGRFLTDEEESIIQTCVRDMQRPEKPVRQLCDHVLGVLACCGNWAGRDNMTVMADANIGSFATGCDGHCIPFEQVLLQLVQCGWGDGCSLDTLSIHRPVSISQDEFAVWVLCIFRYLPSRLHSAINTGKLLQVCVEYPRLSGAVGMS
jgi:hypothetical protein